MSKLDPQWAAERAQELMSFDFTPHTVSSQVHGYVAADVERLRQQILGCLQRGIPLPNPQENVLRRVAAQSNPREKVVSPRECNGLLVLVQMWRDTQVFLPEEKPAPPPPPSFTVEEPRWSRRQIALVREVSFTGKRFGARYEPQAVDDLIARILEAMLAGKQPEELPNVLAVNIPEAKGKAGYVPVEVDDFIDMVARLRPEE